VNHEHFCPLPASSDKDARQGTFSSFPTPHQNTRKTASTNKESSEQITVLMEDAAEEFYE
jgi:hypothetical protein